MIITSLPNYTMNLNWSKKQRDYLFHHILGGFEGSTQSIELAREGQLLTDEEYTALLKKNSQRLIERIKEFKITYRLLSIGFACLFSYMQVNGDDIEMRRPTRVRTRTQQARNPCPRQKK